MTADYTKLRAVLDAAFKQSAEGKGAMRHGNGRDFERQPILEIGRMVGPGFALGQAMNKTQAATGHIAISNLEYAKSELLGAIVYAAAAVVLLEEYEASAKKAEMSRTGGPGGSKSQPTLTPLYPPAPAQPGEGLSSLQRAMRKVDTDDAGSLT